MSNRPRPFISYAREDQRDAIQLYGDLCTLGADPWLDIAALRPGDDWEYAIRQALTSSTHVVALISRHSVNKRGFVQKELRLALEILSEFPPGQIFLIPARLEDVEPRHAELKKIHRVDLFVDRTDAIQNIARTLGLSIGRLVLQPVPLTSKATRASRFLTRYRMQQALSGVSITVNDLLPEYPRFKIQLQQLGIRYRAMPTTSAAAGPSRTPTYSVIVAGGRVGMAPLRAVVMAIAGTGDWYLQVRYDLDESTIVIGSHRYADQKALRITIDVLQQFDNPLFTPSRLKNCIKQRGMMLDADCPRVT
jgi:hypothetical protein